MSEMTSDTEAPAAENATRMLTAFFALRNFVTSQSLLNYPQGMSTNQLKTLHLVAHKPGISQTTVAERLGVTTASISTSVRELETQGLLERRANPDDARVLRLFLAPLGEEIFAKVFGTFTRTFAQFLDVLPPEDQVQLITLLETALTANHISLDIRKLNYVDKPNWMKDSTVSC